MHQNTQFHIEKQKSSTPWEGGHPPPPPPPPPRSLPSLGLGRFAHSQEVFRKFGMLPVASLLWQQAHHIWTILKSYFLMFSVYRLLLLPRTIPMYSTRTCTMRSPLTGQPTQKSTNSCWRGMSDLLKYQTQIRAFSDSINIPFVKSVSK